MDVNGVVWCSGRDNLGQLGNPGSGSVNQPTQVSNVSGAVEVATGFNHSCARLGDGGVRCWGRNFEGQLGDGSREDRAAPVAVLGLGNAIAIDTGGAPTAGFNQNDAGLGHTCAVRASGRVACWGANSWGQLGDGTTERRLTPTNIAQTNAVAVSASRYHTCALRADGIVRCWGRNTYGQLGDGSTITRFTPVRVRNLTGVVAIATGDSYSCALQGSGDLWCWGSGLTYDFGDGPPELPNLVASGMVSVDAGINHTCMIDEGGGVYCFGYDVFGQVGNPGCCAFDTPVLVDEIPSGAVQVGLGGQHSLALLDDGTVLGWGRDDSGQLAAGSFDSARESPVSSFFGLDAP